MTDDSKRPLNFICKYRMDPSICDKVIQYYEDNAHRAYEGVLGNGEKDVYVDKKKKDSIDLACLEPLEEFKHMGEYSDKLYEFIGDYIKTILIEEEGNIGTLALTEPFIIQKYPPGGGYHKKHWERSCINTSKRELVWMTYLTDTPNAGTAFPQWDYVSECEKGLTLVWPAGFTHKHHGVSSKEHEKMIITGWIDWADDEPKDGS
tara:strand:- start:2248 stop:2862 length:615 start_codon:yes stop_codon:yes gene_type:complete